VAVWQSADFEPPTVIAGLDDVTVVGEAVAQSGCHLDVAEQTEPLSECGIGDDDVRAPVLSALARSHGAFTDHLIHSEKVPDKFVRSAAYFTPSKFWAATLNFADACSAGVPFPRHSLW
jgi:hypothetical protein